MVCGRGDLLDVGFVDLYEVWWEFVVVHRIKNHPVFFLWCYYSASTLSLVT